MKTRFWMIAVLVVAFSGAALAQENDGTVADSHPMAGAQKKIRDMSAEERRAYWQSLPEAEKQRIYERRKAMQTERQKKEKWKDQTSVEKAAKHDSTPGQPQQWEKLSPERQQGAKAEWDSMTPEQKKAFVEAHKAEIQAGLGARTNAVNR